MSTGGSGAGSPAAFPNLARSAPAVPRGLPEPGPERPEPGPKCPRGIPEPPWHIWTYFEWNIDILDQLWTHLHLDDPYKIHIGIHIGSI